MNVHISNVSHSRIDLHLNVRSWLPFFSIDKWWLTSLHRVNYGQEMRAKFIPELHQDHEFEDKNLQDILNYPGWIERGKEVIDRARVELDRFTGNYKDFHAVIASDGMQIIKPDHPVIADTKRLIEQMDALRKVLQGNERVLSSKGYRVLARANELKLFNYDAQKNLNDRISYTDIFDKQPERNPYLLVDFIRSFNRVQAALNMVNLWIDNFIKYRNHKIIAGIAGTGKTHTVGYLIEQIQRQGDLVIFLNAKVFNGDHINFEHCFNQKLFIPQGYPLNKLLKRLNRYAQWRGKRLFIIFDALNETTTENLGFSRIWKQELQRFMDMVAQYPYLYFLCTLRTSYIEEIWDDQPEIAVLNGVVDRFDTESMCIKYFTHYKIVVENLHTADLSMFEIPLLLDLYCKMINGDRRAEKHIVLDGNSYLQVFGGYVAGLIQTVRKLRGLLVPDAIIAGLNISSSRFMQNIEGTISLLDFISSFDPAGANVKASESLAQPMLEGNLVFLKESIGPLKEIVKHTQQLIGGYLLAKHLTEVYPDSAALLASAEFRDKIDGANAALRHQLRLDIVKFLVIMKPEIISSITDLRAFQEGWWYLYNGYDSSLATVPQDLIDNPLSLRILPYIMQTSMRRWTDDKHPHNFRYLVKYLGKFGVWESDVNWTHYIYENAELFFGVVEEHRDRLKAGEFDEESEAVFALLIASVTATTVRELRDVATAYLVEYGKLFPLRLLEIAKVCADLKDSYVYQRVIHALYGAVLNLQHDPQFVLDALPEIAQTVFELQFATEATHPVYDYIVIDSIKHLLDLAVYKGVWSAAEADHDNISRYRVPALPAWTPPGPEINKAVDESTDMNPPEPIGMDFRIYTIPRLLEDGNYEFRDEAVANVLGRVVELGFKTSDKVSTNDKRFASFYYGDSLNRQGKVDKLGKKYNWKAFWEYAGHLLQQGLLNTFRKSIDPGSGFERLGDVEIDVSMPNRNYQVMERYYPDDLIPAGERPDGWNMEIKVQTIEPHLIKDINGVAWVMLKGMVESRVDNGYEVRSFIMVESCFIHKSEGFGLLKDQICTRTPDWDGDLHLSPAYDTSTYFGEYYWADSQVDGVMDHFSIRTGDQVKEMRKVTQRHVLQEHFDFKSEDVGQMREFVSDVYVGFDGEPSLTQYLNESNSETFKGFSMYMPTSKMGRHLGLMADPESGLIHDRDGNLAMVTIGYEQGLFKNEATYIRADLMKKYLDDHGYAILYQNKQHSYDRQSPHNRVMKYHVIEL